MDRNDFQVWRHSPAGKWFFDVCLGAHVSELAAALASGSCQADEPAKVAMHYMDQVGVISGIEFVRNLDPFEVDNEAESNRETSAR